MTQPGGDAAPIPVEGTLPDPDDPTVQRSLDEARMRRAWSTCEGAPEVLPAALRPYWRDGIPLRPHHLVAERVAPDLDAATLYLDELVEVGLGVWTRTGMRLHNDEAPRRPALAGYDPTMG